MRRRFHALGAIFLLGSLTVTGCGASEPSATYQMADASLGQFTSDDVILDAPPVDAIAEPIDPDQLSQHLADALAGTDTTGYVYDPFANQAVFDRDSQRSMVPASTLKILTAIAALETLGADTTFTTSVGVTGTQLVLHGGGDVLLGRGASDPDRVDGRAGLGSLARDVVAQLDPGSYTLTIDTSRYTGPQVNEHWTGDLVTSGNISPLDPLALYGARPTPGTKATRESEPTVAVGEAMVAELSAAAGDEYTFTFSDGPATLISGEPIASVTSAPVGELVPYLLRHSENQVSEALGREIALATRRDPSFAGAAEALTHVATHTIGVDGELRIVDASGLSAQNRLTAQQLVQMIGYADTHPTLREPVIGGLAVAGESGTLEDRLGTGATDGVVYAKTGTLTAGITLAGTSVSTGGRPLWFAFMVNGEATPIATARVALDAAVTEITECGCAHD